MSTVVGTNEQTLIAECLDCGCVYQTHRTVIYQDGSKEVFRFCEDCGEEA